MNENSPAGRAIWVKSGLSLPTILLCGIHLIYGKSDAHASHFPGKELQIEMSQKSISRQMTTSFSPDPSSRYTLNNKL